MNSKARFFLYFFMLLALLLIHKLGIVRQGPLLALVMLSGFGYLVYYIVSENHLPEIIGNVIITACIMLGAALIPLVFIPLLIMWSIYNVAKTIDALRSIKLNIIFSLLFGLSLFSKEFFGRGPAIELGALTTYLVTAVIYCRRIAPLPLKVGILDLSITTIAIPVVGLVIATIVSGLRNLLTATLGTVSRNISVLQNVAGHMRGDVFVSDYARSVSKTVTESVARVSAGSGAVALSSAKSIAESVGKSDVAQSERSN